MKAIILAAGRGERLLPYTENCPKCLIELDGMSLVDRQIETLRNAGITDILIVTGYLGHMLALRGTSQVHNPHWSSTNMVESLFCAEAEFGSDVIVSYGDIVYEPRALDSLLASTNEISVVVDQNWRQYWETRFQNPLSDAESLRLDTEGCIVDIGNEVANIERIQAQYIGLTRYRNGGVAALRAARANLNQVNRPWKKIRSAANAYMTDLLMEIVLLGHKVKAIPIEGGWLEIDTVEDYHLVTNMIADGRITQFFDPAAIAADSRS